jgi:hypothetical protein
VSDAKRFKAIAAMSENRVIGNGPKIPWHLPEDFKFFKATTTGQIVVMGRATFESIGRPLPKRETIIVSRSGYTFPGTRTVASLDEIDVNADERDVFICGGAQIYAAALPRCSDCFSRTSSVSWKATYSSRHSRSVHCRGHVAGHADFRIVHYVRQRASKLINLSIRVRRTNFGGFEDEMALVAFDDAFAVGMWWRAAPEGRNGAHRGQGRGFYARCPGPGPRR